MHRPASSLASLAAVPALVLGALASSARALGPALEPTAGPCAGAPLACVVSGGAPMAVAIGVPPRSVAVLVGGAGTEVGPVFGRGRLCVTRPRLRLGCGQANDEGTLVLRMAAPPEPSGCWVQALWRDPLSGQLGASAVARW